MQVRVIHQRIWTRVLASPYITRWEWRVPPISCPRGYYLRRDRGGTCNFVASSLCHANREHGRPRDHSLTSVVCTGCLSRKLSGRFRREPDYCYLYLSGRFQGSQVVDISGGGSHVAKVNPPWAHLFSHLP